MKKKKAEPLPEVEMPDAAELPEGWKYATILDACEVNPPKPPKDFLPADAPVTFVPMPAVDADLGAITNPELKPYLEVRNGFSSFRDGDVIMAKITPCMENGKAAIVHGMKNGIGFGSTEFHVMRSRGDILPEYLYYYVRQESFRNEAESHFTGSVGQKRVPADFIKQSIIPLPPLPEQQRIVARVEALLTQINAARERLNRVPLIMKKFRQAVLAAACSGRLTEGWREASQVTEKDQVNQKISNRDLNEYFDPNNLEEPPINWQWIPLHFVTDYFGGYAFKSKLYVEKSSNQVLRIGNVKKGYVNLGIDPVFIDENYALERKTFELIENDLVISQTGTRYKRDYGYCGLIPKSERKIFLNQRVSRLRCKAFCLPQYLHYWIQTEQYRNYFFLNETGNVNQGNVGADPMILAPIPLPPLAEQHEIVRRVGLLFERADAIDREVAAAGWRCEWLTQAVLARAFSGKLV